MAGPLISAEHMGKRYHLLSGDLQALDDVNLRIEEGEFIAVMGPSGSGKSTFMNLLGCLDVPSEGDYYLNGRAVKSMDVRERARLRNRFIGFVFQGYNLLPRLNCIENVTLPLVYAGVGARERERLLRPERRIQRVAGERVEQLRAVLPGLPGDDLGRRVLHLRRRRALRAGAAAQLARRAGGVLVHPACAVAREERASCVGAGRSSKRRD